MSQATAICVVGYGVAVNFICVATGAEIFGREWWLGFFLSALLGIYCGVQDQKEEQPQ